MRGILLLVITATLLFNSSLVDAASDELLIIKIQTESSESGTSELVTIRNNLNLKFDISGLVIQYKSANGSGWSNRANLSGSLNSLEQLELSTDNGLLNSGMAAGGGHLRIYDSIKELEYDLVGWGSATEPLGESVKAHSKGGQLVRKVNQQGEIVNTQNNAEDFYDNNDELLEAEEQNVDPYEVVNIDNQPDALESSLNKIKLQNTVFPELRVTELMPDPTSPLVDSDDEYIEVFNPNDQPINIEGYTIKIGPKDKAFRLPEYPLQPSQYLAIYSEDSNLSLSNSSLSWVSVIAPNGKEVYRTDKYDEAVAGGSFMLSENDQWIWSEEPTPGEVNIYKLEESEVVDNTEEEEADTDSKDLSSTTDRDYSQLDNRDVYESPVSAPQSDTNFFLLASVGGLALGYAVWEYRNDLANRIHKTRRYFKIGRKARE